MPRGRATTVRIDAKLHRAGLERVRPYLPHLSSTRLASSKIASSASCRVENLPQILTLPIVPAKNHALASINPPLSSADTSISCVLYLCVVAIAPSEETGSNANATTLTNQAVVCALNVVFPGNIWDSRLEHSSQSDAFSASTTTLNVISLRPIRTLSMEVPAGAVFALAVNYDHRALDYF